MLWPSCCRSHVKVFDMGCRTKDGDSTMNRESEKGFLRSSEVNPKKAAIDRDPWFVVQDGVGPAPWVKGVGVPWARPSLPSRWARTGIVPAHFDADERLVVEGKSGESFSLKRWFVSPLFPIVYLRPLLRLFCLLFPPTVEPWVLPVDPHLCVSGKRVCTRLPERFESKRNTRLDGDLRQKLR